MARAKEEVARAKEEVARAEEEVSRAKEEMARTKGCIIPLQPLPGTLTGSIKAWIGCGFSCSLSLGCWSSAWRRCQEQQQQQQQQQKCHHQRLHSLSQEQQQQQQWQQHQNHLHPLYLSSMPEHQDLSSTPQHSNRAGSVGLVFSLNNKLGRTHRVHLCTV